MTSWNVSPEATELHSSSLVWGNQIGGGCHDEDHGLTKFGFKLIEEMDRAGIVKCCSHTGYHTRNCKLWKLTLETA